ncbi:MAG TPA: LysM peptidoglycan-binding domain-containing protein [Anaerolineales bacterium]|nr:LysM peptidoglycan-binding domain-containing protein [Anaerolineales bacterium]
MRHKRNVDLALTALVLGLAAGCAPPVTAALAPETAAPSTESPLETPAATAFPPGTIFDYPAQQGDTLAAVAAHFNTSVDEIRAANPDLPQVVTTFPAGYPLRVPAYYVPLTSTPFHILPDSEATNGPGAIGFDLQAEVESRPGFLKGLTDYAQRKQRPAWDVVGVVARNYSIHPRLLLALLEYQTHALTQPEPQGQQAVYPLGYEDPRYRGLYRQLVWAAERFNDAYYGWRSGAVELDLADGRISRPDPWQNAGSVGVHGVMAGLYGQADFEKAIGPDGLAHTLTDLWGDPFAREVVYMPPSLQQPELGLPFPPHRYWDLTGGPHPSWGDSLPWGALDLAPPSAIAGCAESTEYFTAPADGVVTTSDYAMLMLDLDGDGDQRTGWVVFFYHVGLDDQAPAGMVVKKGDRLGHPSCEGGRATGTHVHLARRFNGEWIPAGGPIPFEMGGWTAAAGDAPYEGSMTKGSKVVPACVCSSAENRIEYTLP